MALKVTRFTSTPSERLLALQHVADVPGDGLALAVGVGGEIELAALGDRLGDGVEPLLGLGSTSQSMAKSSSGRTEPSLGRQVADMTIGGQHGVAGAEILPNGLSLGRGLDDQYVHRRYVLRKTQKNRS
jgi:hypothetical protein